MVNDLVYVAGQLIGVVVDEYEQTKTLLIRKAIKTYTVYANDHEEMSEIALCETAVFVNQKYLEEIDAKFMPSNKESIETIDSIDGRELVFKLLNM
ncbi:hypothetical protein [Weissella bombi]|uniref:Uncharacterized protein n=1 Tax=Weissella bombi TaxID=1505725 RepID=A0A1C4C4W9_9LACO|nr:hypothetical protein [Weissella bombi]SCC14112.1 hypothetical protein GA0061074_12210 [Weissella bombi]